MEGVLILYHTRFNPPPSTADGSGGAAGATANLWDSPLARSYGGRPWEAMSVAGGSGGTTGSVRLVDIVGCTASACTLAVHRHHLPSGATLRIGVHVGASDARPDGSPPHLRRIAAKFLTQTSSGPTRASLHNLTARLEQATAAVSPSDGAAQQAAEGRELARWLREEMATPPSLHRAYWRRRTNPRLLTNVDTGEVRSACAGGARYHTFVLTKEDVGQTLTVATPAAADAGAGAGAGVGAGGGLKALYVGGRLRSELDVTAVPAGPLLVNVSEGRGYVVCLVDEYVGGRVVLGSECVAREASTDVHIDDVVGPVYVTNPSLRFTTLSPAATHPLTTQLMATNGSVATLVPLHAPTAFNADVRILAELRTPCPLPHASAPFTYLRHVTTGADDADDADASVVYYRYDPRLRTLDNTLDAPAHDLDDRADLQPRATCPNVPKTFLNAHTCIRAAACAPASYGRTPITLDEPMLRAFYTTGGSFVYAVSGLRLEAAYAASPCAGVSRWKWLGAGCGAAGASGGLSSGVLSAIGGALRAAAGGIVRDISLNECADRSSPPGEWAAAMGARVLVDGLGCFEHVHPHEYNVYDFSYWTLAHPGNTDTYNPIRRLATSAGGGVVLAFPASHSMARWSRHAASAGGDIELVGRLGDVVDFASLPTGMQSDAMARLVGAVDGARAADGTEACGSPGEVANEPRYGHRFHVYLTNREKALDELVPDRAYGDMTHGKVMVHTMLALRAADQLRQRMAFALSQIYVVGEVGFPRRKEQEVWHTYTDIFVRHAFGNLRDVLLEVTFSAAMATYLTYRRSRSFAFSGTTPDENYAREVMQLFTIGLYQLHENGTQVTARHIWACGHVGTWASVCVGTWARGPVWHVGTCGTCGMWACGSCTRISNPPLLASRLPSRSYRLFTPRVRRCSTTRGGQSRRTGRSTS